jgi:hypothetical protein
MIAVTGRDFFDLVKAIGESKSKQEEDRIITEEVMIPTFVSYYYLNCLNMNMKRLCSKSTGSFLLLT